MKRLFVFILLTTNAIISFSQDESPAFGKADIKELLLKECPFEKEANAMKLLDYQETEIFINGYDLRIQIERRIRIKIFNENGFTAANITIPYIRSNKKSKVNDVTAYIYNLDSTNNKIVTQKLEKNQIFKEKSGASIGTVTFTFPGVKPGSVIEYRYTYSQKNSFNIEPWFFQDEIPTAVSVCKFIYPVQFVFDIRFINTDNMIKESISKQMRNIETFTQKNIYAFKTEPMMSSVKDHLQRVEFAPVPLQSALNILLGANKWDMYTRFLVADPSFGRQIHLKINGTDPIIDSARKISSPDEKIQFIYEQVKSTLKWDETFSFYPDDLNEVWKTKSANSAEINLSILNLLLKSGIKSYPILVSTRSNGKPDINFTSLGQFNNVDILIGDSTKYFILDGTQKHISFKTPPENILNRDILMINNDSLKSKWLTVIDNRPLMKTNIMIRANLNNEAVLKGDANISYFDYSKSNKIEEQNEKQKNIESKEFIEKDVLDVIIDSLIEENAENELLPLVHRFTFTYKLSNTGEYYILDPFFLSRFRQNPFSNEKRSTDIDMGGNQSFNVQLHITIPDNYLIEDLPKNILIRSNDSSMIFKREIIKDKNTLLFRNSFDILRPIYKKEEYPGIREYFKKVYDAFTDQIVLKKKK